VSPLQLLLWLQVLCIVFRVLVSFSKEYIVVNQAMRGTSNIAFETPSCTFETSKCSSVLRCETWVSTINLRIFQPFYKGACVQQLSFVMNESWVSSVQVCSMSSFRVSAIFNHSKRIRVNNDQTISEKLAYCSQGSSVRFLTLSLHSRNKSQSSQLTPFSTVNNERVIVF